MISTNSYKVIGNLVKKCGSFGLVRLQVSIFSFLTPCDVYSVLMQLALEEFYLLYLALETVQIAYS